MTAARIHRGFPRPGAIDAPVVATIGVFDGVHLGHQVLLRRAAQDAAHSATPVLITFDPHPRCVLDPAGCPPLLTTPAERAALAGAQGVMQTVVLEFTRELSTWSAERFCDALVASCALRELVVGPGFALGRARTGDERFLREYGSAHGFAVAAVPPVLHDGAPVSSGRVRAAVLEGDVTAASALLGRRYRLSGTVVRGDGRGRGLGFPTANIATPAERCVPAAGVYASWLRAGDVWRPAATSIGVRPTFGGGDVTVEAFALDFDQEIYGTEVELDFVSRLREERAYPDAAALIAQMHDDVARTRELLRESAAPEPAAR